MCFQTAVASAAKFLISFDRNRVPVSKDELAARCKGTHRTKNSTGHCIHLWAGVCYSTGEDQTEFLGGTIRRRKTQPFPYFVKAPGTESPTRR